MKRQNLQATKENGQLTSSKQGRKKILIADDDPSIQDIFSIIFRRAGYQVEVKKDGEDILKNRFTVPDIFLIDKQLSGYNGLDICKWLKTQRHTSNIPVIIISAAPDLANQANQAGADSYLEKPFDVNTLLKLVWQFVSGDS